MKSNTQEQKKLKVFVIILIIVAVLFILAAGIMTALSRLPEASDKNPFGEEAITEETNVFREFWNNITSFFTGKKNPAGDPDGKNEGEDVPPVINTDDTPGGEEDPEKPGFKRKEGFYNFLLLGKDKGGLNTDVIMILSFDTENDKIHLVQIPRDTYVNIPYNFKKINSVFSVGYSSEKSNDNDDKILGGVKLLEDTILTNYGIVIDRYVFVDISGFKSIVDAIGGVDVYVQNDMNYDDPYQDLHIHLKKGPNHLDGAKAEQFVRFRYGYVNADLGRMDAQKIFMSAFLKKLFSVSSITKIPDLASQVMKYVTTDVSLGDAVLFGKQLLELDMSDISMLSLPGEATWYNGGSYYSTYEKSTLQMVNDYFNAFDREVTSDDVDMAALVTEPAGYEYNGGKSAQDIDDNNPALSFLR